MPAYNGNAFAAQGITQGPDGNVWVTSSNTVWAVNASGVAAQYTVPTPYFQPGGIVTGADGDLWFTDRIANNIGRLTTDGIFAEYPIPSASSVPTNIVMGADGNLWFTEQGANQVAKFVLSAAPSLTTPLTVSPPSLVFTAYAGGPSPPSQTLTITSQAPVTFTATPSQPVYIGQPWLQISPSGNLTTNQTITVTVDPRQIGAYATYVGNISLTSGGVTQVVPVMFTVTRPPTTGNISVSPPSVSYAFSTEGLSPEPQELEIKDATQGVSYAPVTISYNVISPPGGNWLTLTGDNVPFPSGFATTAETGFFAKVNTSELSPGTYSATITVSATGGNTVSVPVSLTLMAGATSVSTSPSSLHFTWQAGAPTPAPQSFQVVESGDPEPFETEVNGGGIILTAVATGNSVSVTLNTSAVTAGTYVQPVFITAVPFSLGLSTQADVILTATGPKSNISGIVNAASFESGVISAGEMITIFGKNLGPTTPLGLALDSSGKVATSLGGVTVSIDGHLAPLTYVSDTQINCVAPYDLAEISNGIINVPVVVSYGGQQSEYAITTGAAAPAVFTSSGSGTGPAAILNASVGYNGPGNPASAGSTIVIYTTGEGQTIPAGVTGAVTAVNTSPGAMLTPIPALPLRVTIGGMQAPVTFLGEAPGIVAGAMQINAQIPDGLPSGDLPLVVSLGGIQSQSGVTVSVR